MRRRDLLTSSNLEIITDKTQASAGDVCISDGNGIYFVSLDNWQTYNGNTYNAIGVVASPAGEIDDKVRVGSLVYMDYNNPDVGNINGPTMGWNGYNTGLTSFQATNSSSNARGCYNGKDNTNRIIGVYATGQSGWKTAEKITNSNSSSTNKLFPSFCCCWRFHTPGTNQGDWYLPAAGELEKLRTNSLAKNTYSVLLSTLYASDLWSSTSYSSGNTRAWNVVFGSGYISGSNRYSQYKVLAFLQV